MTPGGALVAFMVRLAWCLPIRLRERLCIETAISMAGEPDARAALVSLLRSASRLETLAATTAVRFGDGVSPKHRIMRYHDFFVARVRRGERVLDIGSGNGFLSAAMAQAGAHVEGIEISPENVEIARSLHPHPNAIYRVGDATQDPPPGPFDVVVMSNVLEHLRDRADLLRRLARSTSAHRFLIRVPRSDRNWFVSLRRELGLDWRMDATHEIEYTMQEFLDEMAAADFKVVETDTRWGEIWAVAHPLKGGEK